MDLLELQSDPAKYRAALLIETDGGPKPLGKCMDVWQKQDFRALDGGWQRAVKGAEAKPSISGLGWNAPWPQQNPATWPSWRPRLCSPAAANCSASPPLGTKTKPGYCGMRCGGLSIATRGCGPYWTCKPIAL